MTETAPVPTASPSSLRLIATLAGIAIMSGLLVALAAEFTREPILKNRREALEKAVFTVLPEATARKNFLLNESGLTPLGDDAISEANCYAGYNESGELVGVAIEASARGYQDVVKILYGYNPHTNCILGFTVLQSSETPGLGDRVETDPDFLANFACLEATLNEAGTDLKNQIVTVKNGTKKHPWQIDAISGATVTSTAIGTALQKSTTKLLPLIHKVEPEFAQ
ncbi:MAG TPA: FMN-binding protein [Lentisphaeria bacterium]|nr:FMN-binding protein [Lentisphaeria bacterium]